MRDLLCLCGQNKFLVSSILGLLVSISSYAAPTYYPETFVQLVEQKNTDKSIDEKVDSEQLKSAIFAVLTGNHLRSKELGAEVHDKIVADCPVNGEASPNLNCYRQITLEYDDARKYLFGDLHLEKNNGRVSINEVYCHETITQTVAPMSIPSDKFINCEHTWPQSRFNSRFSIKQQKGDLHHLFPANPKANGIRGNHPFGEVRGGPVDNCPTSTIGEAQNGQGRRGELYFEPPAEHKGNVARALFYFSVRYQLPIEKTEEAYLREWNKIDPIDEEESSRNERIYKIQGNRNPFIDFPELVDSIRDF